MQIINVMIEVISIFNNIFQFIATFLGLYAVFIILSNRYKKPLVLLLKPLGLTGMSWCKILWICKSKPKVYIRVFIEYAIIRSGGVHQSKVEWKEILFGFERMLRKSKEDNRYLVKIENCTKLLSSDISMSIKAYYDYFEQPKVRTFYLIKKKTPIEWLLEIRIAEGFMSPLFLLSGLLARYEDNWSTFIARFVSGNFTQRQGAVLPEELYFTFAWLLWGPSYELQDQDVYYKLCQYSFGDESNSLRVVIENESSEDSLWEAINTKEGVYGSYTQITCTLYYKKEYLLHNKQKFNPKNYYFLNKALDDETSFVLKVNEYNTEGGYKAKNYYCTAYVWIMFELIDPKYDYFSPPRTIVFFEHANLANNNNYEFLIQALINKSFSHFDRIFKQYDTRRYRYCLAMNRAIDEAFMRAYHQRPVTQQLIVDKKYSEEEIFTEMDHFFSSNNSLSIREVAIEDKRTMDEFGQFFTSVYIPAFPNPDERESLENMMMYLRQKQQGSYGKNNYHILLVKNKEQQVVGGVICDYFKASNSGVIEFIAIGREFQSMKIGSYLYYMALNTLNKDAKSNGHKGIDYMFCEIENPALLVEEASKKYFYFWNKLGFQKIEFEYVQPPLDGNKAAVDSLWFVVLKMINKKTVIEGIETELVKSVLYDYAKYAMGIEVPERSRQMAQMFAQLDDMGESVAIQPLFKDNQ